MKKLIVFNWKMAPQSLVEARRLLAYNQQPITNNFKYEIVIAPPFVYLPELKAISYKLKAKFAAQDVFWEANGAYTGEISPKMLKNLGVEYVIIGHSERRQILGETDKMVNKKVLSALSAGLKVILCVGEDMAVSKKGKKAVEQFIKAQLSKDLLNVNSQKLKVGDLTIAYEPIWAISSTKNKKDCDPQYASEKAQFIKSMVKGQGSKVQVLYGGSVNSKNVLSFINQPEIDGALVGRASVDVKEFKKILQQIANSQ